MGEAPAPHGRRRALWHRARARGALGLLRYAAHEIARHVAGTRARRLHSKLRPLPPQDQFQSRLKYSARELVYFQAQNPPKQSVNSNSIRAINHGLTFHW